MKTYSVMVPGSEVTAKTAAGYLLRLAKHFFSKEFGISESLVLTEIEERLVNAGLLTWTEIDEI